MTPPRWLGRAADALRGAGSAGLQALPDALMLAGAAAISYGAWLVYAPAGFITGGVLLVAGGVLAQRGA